MLKTLPIVLGQVQRICAWCSLEMAAGTLPASHGICGACAHQLENGGAR